MDNIDRLYDLECKYDTRKSFYNKAKYEILKNSLEQVVNLYSYNTLVARRTLDIINMEITYEYLGKYSQTTTRHQKEFFKQFGLNDKEIKKLFKNGEMVVIL